jgi:KDO2-lipid IV(A) lauroyltransferase
MAVLREPGRGLILVSGHLGNWEIAARALSAIKPVLGIARPMNNPLAEALLRARLDSANIEWTAKHAADAGRLLGAVRGGKLLALLIDQHARDRGMPIDFFGAPAWTHTSPALLHLVTGAPLVFGFCWRTGPMSYAIEALKPIFHAPTGNKEHDIRAILARLTRELETAIRAHPEQYLWVHRRWKAPSQWPAAGTR